MKQYNIFNDELEDIKKENKYTSKISIPIYEPKNNVHNIYELFDHTKYLRLKQEIENDENLTKDEKKFLIFAATRHIVFNYQKIADYYANSTENMQKYIERSALVIIDFNKAFEFGYIELSNEIANQYFDNYGE